MEKKNSIAAMGRWAFLIGIVVALIAGLVTKMIGQEWTMSILIVMGLIVGFFNVTESETKDYLMASVSMVIVTWIGGDIIGNVAVVGEYLKNVLNAMTIFVVPATILVALKAIYSLAKDE
jgi:hypothetical protein